MTGLKFELDIDAEIQKLGLPPAKVANPANLDLGISNFSKIDNSRTLIPHKPDRCKSIKEAAELFRKRGWIQIWSGYLKEHIYLVRGEKVKVPDKTVSKYTQIEIEALVNLSFEEMQTLHEAKCLLQGTINFQNKKHLVNSQTLKK